MINKNNYFIKYFSELNNLIAAQISQINNLLKIKKLLTQTVKNNKKIIIFGNGGSSAIASHFTNDLNKNTKIRCLNFTDSTLLTCLSNDYGYKNIIVKILESYADHNDTIIFISSSGESLNMINGSRFAKKIRCKTVTFTGFKKNNTLSSLGDINVWINSKKYNFIENIHQVLLLSIIDSIIDEKKK
jgi:D-sedoheptulose 7-phosphate isomerase